MSLEEAAPGRSTSQRLNPAASWRTDVETAQADLEATAAQAFLVAAHAFAWRTAALTLPSALVVAGWLVARGDAGPSVLLLAAVLGALGPQLLASLLTLPVEWFATAQAWIGGSRTAQVRFGLMTFVYPYYGWRYAYRGRRRPWGALTREERMLVNPRRAGAPGSATGAQAPHE